MTIKLQDIQFRRNTSSYYTTVNPLLLIGEPAFEIDTYKFKIGNGTDRWTDLPYVSGGSGESGSVDSVNGNTGVVILDADDIDDSSTINKFVTASDINKLSNITVTQAVNLDTLENIANSALQSFTETDPLFQASQAFNITAGDITKLSNLSGINTGDETGSTLTSKLDIQLSNVRWKVIEVPDGGTTGQVLKKSSNTDYDYAWSTDNIGASGGVDSVNGESGIVILDADDINDTSTANKFVTASDIIKLSNLSGSNTGDQDISGIVTNATAISSLNSSQSTQDQAIALNTAKVSYPGPQDADEVPVSPTINGNSNVQNVLTDHETRINNIEGSSVVNTRTYVNSTSNGLTGTQNGINTTFTVSQNSYISGSLLAFVSGVPLSVGHGLSELDSSSGTFTITDAPQSYDIIIINYSN